MTLMTMGASQRKEAGHRKKNGAKSFAQKNAEVIFQHCSDSDGELFSGKRQRL